MKKVALLFFQNILVLFRPILTRILFRNKAKLKGYQAHFKDSTLSGMVNEFNFFHGLLFLPFFRRVQTISTDLSKVKALNGPVVYVLKNRGQLEYRYFNYLFLKEKVSAICYANNCLTLFWWPFKVMWQKLICKIDHFYCNWGKEKFDVRKHITTLLKEDKNILLNLSVSRDYLFGLIRSDPLTVLDPLIDVQRDLQKPIHVVTLQFLYDKHPDKTEKTYFDLLFGEKSQPGGIRKFLLFVMNYKRRPRVKFGDPIDLKRFIATSEKVAHETQGQRLLSAIENDLKIEKSRITGPLLKSKESIIKGIMNDENFQEQLICLAKEENKKFDAIKREAQSYLNEIAADVSYSFVHFAYITLTHIWNRMFSGLVVKHEDLNKIREKAGKNPIVLVPMHRSHIDYLLISYIFYERNITFPHICAGINLNFWPAGRYIRKGGGFFIRRAFEGNRLYKETLYAYIKTLVHMGYCIEFFIEGTRSRTGKLLKPKMGILSHMMRAYFEGACEDICFVPIAINYDHILEHRAYQAEGAGADKTKENAGELLKARKVVRKKYGKVYIEFADPISLRDYCEERKIETREMETMRKEVSDFAYHLTYHINKVAIVTPISLVSLAILSINKSTFTFDSLMNRIKLLKEYLDFKDVVYSDLINYSDQYAYNEAIKKLCERQVLREVETFEDRFFMFEERHRQNLDYYKNNCLHFFVSLACFCKVINSVPNHNKISIDETIKQFEVIKTLLRHDFTFSERATVKEHILKVIQYCVSKGYVAYDEDLEKITRTTTSHNEIDYVAYQGLLDNFLEAQDITLRYLKHAQFKKMEKKALIKDILTKAKPMYLKDELTHPESLSRFNLENAFKVCLDLGILKDESQEKGRHFYTTTNEIETIDQWIELIEKLLRGISPVVGGRAEKGKDEVLIDSVDDLH